jgi:hypothetical protein
MNIKSTEAAEVHSFKSLAPMIRTRELRELLLLRLSAPLHPPPQSSWLLFSKSEHFIVVCVFGICANKTQTLCRIFKGYPDILYLPPIGSLGGRVEN